ncbi:MAG: hypothetical protein RLO80_03565 [Hyphomonas sp.]
MSHLPTLALALVVLSACQTMQPRDPKEPAPCDFVSVAGEFKNLGPLPFKLGMTALDAFELGQRTYLYRGIYIERGGEVVKKIHSSVGLEPLSKFKLEPCDVIRGIVGPF